MFCWYAKAVAFVPKPTGSSPEQEETQTWIASDGDTRPSLLLSMYVTRSAELAVRPKCCVACSHVPLVHTFRHHIRSKGVPGAFVSVTTHWGEVYVTPYWRGGHAGSAVAPIVAARNTPRSNASCTQQRVPSARVGHSSILLSDPPLTTPHLPRVNIRML